MRERKDVELVLGQGMLARGRHAHTLDAPGKFLSPRPSTTLPVCTLLPVPCPNVPLMRFGVRVFTDTVASGEPVPDEATLVAILRSGERAGRTDPYRHVAALLHLVVVRH